MARRDDPEDEERGEDAPRPWARVLGSGWLGWGGLGVAIAGALIRIGAGRGDGLRAVGAGMVLVGLAALVVGRVLARRVEVDEEPAGYTDDGAEHDPERKVRLGVAAASGAMALLGVGLLVKDALGLEQAGTAWPFLVGGAIGLVVSGIWAAAVAPQPRDVVVGPPEPPSRRRWIAAAVGALLLVEAATPLRYYLGDDIFDERFSWRMFSAVRVYACNLTAFETREGAEVPADLPATIHVGWITTMRRNREDVLRRYLEWRCEQDGVEAARIVNRCTTPEGNRVPDVVRTLECEGGEVEALTVELQEASP